MKTHRAVMRLGDSVALVDIPDAIPSTWYDSLKKDYFSRVGIKGDHWMDVLIHDVDEDYSTQLILVTSWLASRDGVGFRLCCLPGHSVEEREELERRIKRSRDWVSFSSRIIQKAVVFEPVWDFEALEKLRTLEVEKAILMEELKKRGDEIKAITNERKGFTIR